MPLERPLREAAALLLHALWPVSCPLCGRLGQVLCPDCTSALFAPLLPRCLSCGAVSPCRTHPNAPMIRAAALYGGDISRVILQLKYAGCRALGARLGAGMAALWPPPAADFLVPVPLHIGSSRNYNQALEIARGLGRAWGVPVLDAARWTAVLPARTGLSRTERQSLRPDAFALSREVAGRRVVLVDDVCTTGTTLSCLAAACRSAGAVVQGACVAAGSAGTA